MRVFYLSDLHLRDGAGAQAARFATFLRSTPGPADIVVLGGDIFDLLVGNKLVFRYRFREPIAAIQEAAGKGARVYYLEGNHDFELASVFSGAAGVEVCAGDLSLEVGGHRIFVTHGDLIDPDDKGYRLLRAVTKSRPFRGLISAMPGAFIDGIGSWSSRQSRDYNVRRDSGAAQERIRALYLGYARERVREGARHVLVGHSHLKDQIPIVENGARGEYVNLGFSSAVLPYAVLEPGAEAFALRELP